MTLKPYSNYKDSGVEWLGQVPEHWAVAPIKRGFIVKLGKMLQPKAQTEHDLLVPYMRASNIQPSGIDISDVNEMWLSPAEIKSLKLVSGDLLVSEGGDVGRCALWRDEVENCYFQNSINRVRSSKSNSNTYLMYLIQSIKDKGAIDVICNKLSIAHLTAEKLNEIKISYPLYDEQTAIATYLDRETARLDELIAHKTRFIELLKEKRSALITHAVTKGLNPNTPMKDSGVEWLGQVPEHWEVMAIKHIVETPITDGPHETPEFIDDGVPFVSAEAVSNGYIDFNKIRGYISEEDDKRYSKKYRPRRNDIFMIKSGATTGITAIVDTDIKFNIWSPLAVIRCGKRSNPKFVLNFMRSKSYQEAIKLNWSFGTQQNIGMGVIGDIAIPVPPIQEQTAIAAYLDQETALIDELVQLTEQSINLIKERRSVLITAAVTGKIDVREQNSIGITS